VSIAARVTDSVELSSTVAEALTDTGLFGDVCRHESLERGAWIALVLRQLEDTAERFPCGKWATIQRIERQLDQAVADILRGAP
jgi:hypothetical protein